MLLAEPNLLSLTRWRGSFRAWPFSVALIAAGCSSSSEAPQAVLLPNPTTIVATATTLPLGSASGAVVEASGAGNADIEAADIATLSPKVAFSGLSIDPFLEVIALAESDIAQLEARFRSDERLAPFLVGVDAKAIRRDGELVAVGLSVAVSPEALAVPGFLDSFVEGATQGGVLNPLPEEIGPVAMTAWLAEDAGSLLWQHENLFIILSGRDLVEVRSVAEAVVASVLALDLDQIRPLGASVVTTAAE